MKFKEVIASLFIGTMLVGCDQSGKTTADPANWLSVPTLPIIQDAILPLAPTFGGQRDGVLSQQICALATGKATQGQINEQLRKLNIEPTRLPLTSNDAVALLVNGNVAAQTIACAAYQATEVLRPIDMRDVIKPASQASDLQEQGTTVAEVGKEKGREKEASKATAPAKDVDAGRVAQLLPLRIAQARANADIFALIAEQLQRTPGLTIQEYRDKARDLFIRLAPIYLERIAQQMPPSNAGYQVQQMDARRFVFSNNVGARFDYSVENGLLLSQNGVIWYGNGHLLGSVYRLRAAYFPAGVSKLLAAKQP
ncbi:hypothetical protein [Pseudomonas sp. PDM19]|uniref:hypothetical protein n=1 Tax=Pseudomonas sp. PDM19 TaxID=2769272 RepID=UPI00177B4A03|nr:hypothetical protein [Pseudomonas sp. PDM19]MBD9629263.1 hypothetical protein [Pseudomonas sp. PDM19]